MPFFRIKGLSPALDGLIVESPGFCPDSDLCDVTRLVNPNVFVGDRTLSYPLLEGGMMLRRDVLVDVDDPQLREFAHDRPWGRFLFEGSYVQGNIHVAFAAYQTATQVTLTEKQGDSSKTLYADYFPAETVKYGSVREYVEACMLNNGDADDLIFGLKKLKEK